MWPLTEQPTTTPRKGTMQHRRNSVQSAMATVRATDHAGELVDAIRSFDAWRGTIVNRTVLTWNHSYGNNSEDYHFAAVVADGKFYCTDGGVYDWDGMVEEWVTYNVRPAKVDIVQSTYPMEAF